MTNETQLPHASEPKQAPFGTRLQSVRESLGLERKDAAMQLRLNEKFIIMMEKDRYPIDLPVTFIRGYIRSYSNLLKMPEAEVKKALDQIKPKAPTPSVFSATTLNSAPLTSGNYFMQIFTYLIVVTLLGLVCIWWYTHTNNPPTIAENTANNNLASMEANVANNEPSASLPMKSTKFNPKIAKS